MLVIISKNVIGVVLVTLVIGSVHASSANKFFPEIINGTPVSFQHPLASSVVGLFAKADDPSGAIWFSQCTGTVLNSKYILTAAHCVKDSLASDMAINFSINSIDNDIQQDPTTRLSEVAVFKKYVLRKAKGYKIHPAYDGSGLHDLALISLSGKMPKTARPVKLLPDSLLIMSENKTTFEGQTLPVTLMGFGMISEDPAKDTDVLRITTVSARFENNLVVTDQTKGSGGCHGDSGGPAFLDYLGVTYQVGVTHGPHEGSTNCHEEGEWVNPALDKAFLKQAMAELK